MKWILNPFRFFFWGLWTACCISYSFIAVLFTFDRSTAVRLSKSLWARGALFIPGVKLEVKENSRIDYSKPYVFVSNHQSYLDIPSIMKAVKTPLYFIGKKELKKIPFLGWYMTISGMIFIDRSSRKKAFQSLKDAAQSIKNGKSIIVFPEGTRTKDGHLNEFKKGPFALALDAEVSIIPIAISGTGKIFPSSRLLFTPGKAIVSICDPIDTSNFSKENLSDLISQTKAIIQEEKDRIENA